MWLIPFMLLVPHRLINSAQNTKKLPCFQSLIWKQRNPLKVESLANQEPALRTGVDGKGAAHLKMSSTRLWVSRKLAQFPARGTVQVMRVGLGLQPFFWHWTRCYSVLWQHSYLLSSQNGRIGKINNILAFKVCFKSGHWCLWLPRTWYFECPKERLTICNIF